MPSPSRIIIPSLPKPLVIFKNPKDMLWRVRQNWTPPEHLQISELEYARKYVKIKTEQDLVVPFRINQVQQLYYNAKQALPMPRATGKRILILKARRMGFTTIEQIISYAKCRTRRNTNCVTIAHTTEATRKIFSMILRMNKEDPNKARLDKDRKDAIAYKVLGSEIAILTAGGKGSARGDGISKVHGSEVAFWELNEQDFRNLFSSLNEATRAGEMTFESTAKGTSGWYYDQWQECSTGKGIFAPMFFGWHLDSRNQVSCTKEEVSHIIDTLTDDEISLVEKFHCTPNQLMWRREKIKGKDGPKMFRQEYPATPEEAFISSGTSYFDLDGIDRAMKRAKDPIYENEYGYSVWAHPEAGKRYVIGVDTSEGNEESDDTPICVLDYDTGEQVARLNARMKPHILGAKCVEMAKLYNGALLAIENNNTGHSVLNTVMNQEFYTNIYWHVDDVREEEKESITPGWRTTPRTRPLLLSELDDSVEKGYMKANDKLFLSQCRVFKYNASGKAEVARGSGNHGDLVIAWGIAWQARKMKWSSGSLMVLGD